MNAPPRSLVPCLIAVVLALATVGSPGVVQARITKVQITTTETPTFGGYSWPGVGQYEKIAGKAFGEGDPFDPKNTVIADIELAPRNTRGKVEYSSLDRRPEQIVRVAGVVEAQRVTKFMRDSGS